MNRAKIIGATVGMAACLVCANAWAQGAEQPSYWVSETRAPREAFELTVGTAYTQGFGMISGETSVPDIAKPGIGFDLGLGYRISPRFSVGVEGQYQEFSGGNTLTDRDSARGLSLGINGAIHFMPYQPLDPWVKVATGYRFLWEQHDFAPNVMHHGFRLIGANVGLDWRVSPDVALGPQVGADLDMYLWQDVQGIGSSAIGEVRASTYIYAGLQGRFDMGGTRERMVIATTASR